MIHALSAKIALKRSGREIILSAAGASDSTWEKAELICSTRTRASLSNGRTAG